MGPQTDKLFLEVAGRPLVAHTWERFERAACIDEIVIVMREGMEQTFNELGAKFSFRKPFRFARGGKERQDSVWNGLQALDPASEIVAIQDAARPCTKEALIQATVDAARQHGAAVAAQLVSDTIKESADGAFICAHLDRSRLWAVQTPQTFRTGVIRRALERAREKGVVATDDTAACELVGQPVRLVGGFGPNPKLTFPDDVPFLELLLKGPK